MGICHSGMDRTAQAAFVSIKVAEEHPLIQLAQTVQWQELSNLILWDLKKTPAGKWWVGRKLKLRVHLGVYLLQQIFNKTDRQIEYDVKDNAAFQIFCGRYIVDKWQAPDHTKIEEFRSRLSPETQKKLANHVAFHAARLGFAIPEEYDIDSTIQEANMTYPADSSLLKKLGAMCHKAAKSLSKIKGISKDSLSVNMKKISSVAREYFFMPKNSTKELKNSRLKKLLKLVTKEVEPIIKACENLSDLVLKKMPWHKRITIKQIRESSRQYLKDVLKFLCNGVVESTKRLSFHLKEVSCFTKGKPGKKYQFGRVIQLGRIGGNFFLVGKCTTTHMPDKKSLIPMITEHENLFGKRKIKSLSTDKGYYSSKNEKIAAKKGIEKIGIQRPYNIRQKHPKPISKECQEKLTNRRSGIEPLIGHVKQKGQLGRSRMKSDKTIENSSYSSVLGFNLRQLIRHQQGKYGEKAA